VIFGAYSTIVAAGAEASLGERMRFSFWMGRAACCAASDLTKPIKLLLYRRISSINAPINRGNKIPLAFLARGILFQNKNLICEL
jgi:hypothetical protein